MLPKLLLIIFFCLLLSRATKIITTNLIKVAHTLNLSKFALTSFLLALATSLPELVVSTTAALSGNSNLALGNALGSNIADLSLVLGFSALFAAPILIRGEIRAHRLLPSLLLTLAPIILVLDHKIARLEGLLLIVLYFSYVWRKIGKEIVSNHTHSNKQLKLAVLNKPLLAILTATGLLILSAKLIVSLAESFALSLGIPITFVGLFIISVGTSLPELAFEIRAMRERQVTLAFGDLIGSLVANATLVVGLAALISPIVVRFPFVIYQAGLQYCVVVVLFLLFTHSKHELSRQEAFVLSLFFFYFVVLELVFN